MRRALGLRWRRRDLAVPSAELSSPNPCGGTLPGDGECQCTTQSAGPPREHGIARASAGYTLRANQLPLPDAPHTAQLAIYGLPHDLTVLRPSFDENRIGLLPPLGKW